MRDRESIAHKKTKYNDTNKQKTHRVVTLDYNGENKFGFSWIHEKRDVRVELTITAYEQLSIYVLCM
jgi:hypothetical protein